MKKMYLFLISFVVSLFLFSSSILATIPTTNQEAYFKFDEESGSVVSNTAVPSNAGTVEYSSWSEWVEGAVHNGLHLGGNSYVSFDTEINLPNDFTVAAWVKLDDDLDDNDILFGSENSTPYAYFQGDKFRFTGGNGLVSDSYITADTWVHVALVRKGSTTKIYMNGEYDGVYTNSFTSTLKIGKIGGNNNTEEIDGVVDEFYIYDNDLTNSEIETLYDVGSPAFAFSDNFTGSTLGSGWSWVRENSSYWSLTTYNGYMNIKTTTTTIHASGGNTRNILLRDAPDNCATYWEIRTKIDNLSFTANNQEGGLIIYMDDDNFVKLTAIQTSGVSKIGLAYEESGTLQAHVVTPASFPSPLELKLVKNGDDYIGYYHDGTDWVEVYSYAESGFTNLEVGLISQGVSSIDVKYDYFDLD